MRDYDEIVKVITKFLNREKIPYMLVGAVSISYYGTPRTSIDIDLVVQLEGRIKEFVSFLNKNHFSVNKEEIETALKEKSHFTVFDEKSPYRLDIKGIYTKLDKESFQRRRKVKAYGQEVWMNSAEDAIVFKLWFGSEKDLNDAKGIMVRQKNKLDKKYLEKGIKELKLEKIYSKIIKEIERMK